MPFWKRRKKGSSAPISRGDRGRAQKSKKSTTRMPPVPMEVEHYLEWHRRRLDVPAGITGLSQVSGGSDLSFDEWALLDIWYAENWTFLLDLKIMLKTVGVMLWGRGAY